MHKFNFKYVSISDLEEAPNKHQTKEDKTTSIIFKLRKLV